jgi:hypothetical protein
VCSLCLAAAASAVPVLWIGPDPIPPHRRHYVPEHPQIYVEVIR